MQFKIYTDGSCSGNNRDSECPGGWAYIVFDHSGTKILEGSGSNPSTTNNIMELFAAYNGIKKLIDELNLNWESSKIHDCLIITDSRYLCDNFEDYLEDWKKNGWRKRNGSLVANKSYWKMIDTLTPELKSIRFQWIKAHHRDKHNIMVDEMAQAMSKKPKP